MNMETVKLGKLEIDLNELSKFLVEAKKNGYAGDGKKIKLENGSKIYTFSRENFYYADTYSGSLQAPGFEVVRWKDSNGPWAWFMGYSGGMLPKFWGNKSLVEKTFSFLKEALLRVTLEKPFRGPEVYKGDGLAYINSVRGDIKRFNGKEKIIYKAGENVIFSQDFIGGLVIPKIEK